MEFTLKKLSGLFPFHWDMRRVYHLPNGSAPGQRYFVDWEGGPTWVDPQFDERGVLRCGFPFDHPIAIAQFALSRYGRAIDGDEVARKAFFDQARFLRDAQNESGEYRFPFAHPAYGADVGWISGMAQGEAASVLLRAGLLSGDEAYSAAARRALQPLTKRVSEGGASTLSGDRVFFEEVAVEPCTHILNGHLYAAFAMWEYAHFDPSDTVIRELHEGAVETLRNWLPFYDVTGWSAYDVALNGEGQRHLASLYYHQLHIAQMYVYGVMTGREEFTAMGRRWEASLGQLPRRAQVWTWSAGWVVRALMRQAHLAPPLRWDKPVPRFSDAARTAG